MENEEKLKEKDSLKRRIIILWIVFAVCLVATVILWFVSNNTEAEYEEVNVTVVSAETKQVVNRKTGSRTNFYEVKVRFDGETKNLENAHNTYMYPEGKTVKAYLSNGRLFANVEGVNSSTPIATVYFVFLFATMIMLFVAATYSGKLAQRKNA